MRILVADIALAEGKYLHGEPAKFLGLRAGAPCPERLIWRGHEVIIKNLIPLEEMIALKPDFVMALTSFGRPLGGIERYEYFFRRGVPVFTWGNETRIPVMMAETGFVERCQAESKRIVIHRPEHPIMRGVEDIGTSGCDRRVLVHSLKAGTGLAYDPDNASWEIIYLEEWFGNHRWLHYHPSPCPPEKLIDNMLTYMTRPKDKATPSVIGATAGGAIAGIASGLATKKAEYGAIGALVGAVIGGVAGWLLSE